MNTLTRTLITTFPLLCAAGVAAAPAAAHPESGAAPAARPSTAEVAPTIPPSPICAGGGARGAVVPARPPERVGQADRPSQRAAVPGAVPTPPPAPDPQKAPTSTGQPAAAGGPVSIILGAAVAVVLPPRPAPEGVRKNGLSVQPWEPPSGTVSCGRESTAIPVTVPRGELVPAPVPVQVTIHDLGSAPGRPQGADRGAGARPEIEVMVRARGGSGSAAELPAVVRELLRSLAAQQRVPAPRPHR
ncbi:hypothetical protein [Nocardia sp. NPDC060249]|uniref:hypothetical protein n=1 Tax=Nocardia sp. NPDC060249 TaxID=3347082 RepID=UPI00365A990F